MFIPLWNALVALCTDKQCPLSVDNVSMTPACRVKMTLLAPKNRQNLTDACSNIHCSDKNFSFDICKMLAIKSGKKSMPYEFFIALKFEITTLRMHWITIQFQLLFIGSRKSSAIYNITLNYKYLHKLHREWGWSQHRSRICSHSMKY